MDLGMPRALWCYSVVSFIHSGSKAAPQKASQIPAFNFVILGVSLRYLGVGHSHHAYSLGLSPSSCHLRYSIRNCKKDCLDPDLGCHRASPALHRVTVGASVSSSIKLNVIVSWHLLSECLQACKEHVCCALAAGKAEGRAGVWFLDFTCPFSPTPFLKKISLSGFLGHIPGRAWRIT